MKSAGLAAFVCISLVAAIVYKLVLLKGRWLVQLYFDQLKTIWVGVGFFFTTHLQDFRLEMSVVPWKIKAFKECNRDVINLMRAFDDLYLSDWQWPLRQTLLTLASFIWIFDMEPKPKIIYNASLFHPPLPLRWIWHTPMRRNTPFVSFWPWWAVGTWGITFMRWGSRAWTESGWSSTLHKSAAV